MASAADVPAAPTVRSRRSRRAYALRGGLLAAALLALPACYTVAPTATSRLTPGVRMTVDVSDQGRVALRERVGPEIRRLGGTYVGESNGEIEMRVTDVTDLNGTRTNWSGETIRLTGEQVKDLYERKFSRGRTAVAVGLVTAGLVAWIASRGLFGFGGDEGGVGGDGSGQGQQ